MTEIRKAVLEVCRRAELSDIFVIEDWKKKYKQFAIDAVLRKDKSRWSCNKTAVQETVQFTETALRDTDVVAMTISWVEKNSQTGNISLQTATCIKMFGNTY